MWQLSKIEMPPSVVLRPFVMIRLLPDKDLQESQIAEGMYALHNPDAGLPCVSCKTFTKLGETARLLDRKIKREHEAVIECPMCKVVHVLTTKNQPDGWVTLSRPL